MEETDLYKVTLILTEIEYDALEAMAAKSKVSIDAVVSVLISEGIEAAMGLELK